MTNSSSTGRERLFAMLKHHAFLGGLSEQQLSTIVELASFRTVEPQSLIAKDGEPALNFSLIVSGQVAIEIHTPARGTVRIQTLGPGEVVGWSWLVSPHRWQFDARVIQTTQVIEFESAKLRAACEGDHELGYELLKRLLAVIAGRLRHTRVQLLDVYQ